MKTKEEALKLVSEFDMLMPSSEYVDNYEIAKKCALKAVDERIKEILIYPLRNGETYIEFDKNRLKYLQEVKQEIEKL